MQEITHVTYATNHSQRDILTMVYQITFKSVSELSLLIYKGCWVCKNLKCRRSQTLHIRNVQAAKKCQAWVCAYLPISISMEQVSGCQVQPEHRCSQPQQLSMHFYCCCYSCCYCCYEFLNFFLILFLFLYHMFKIEALKFRCVSLVAMEGCGECYSGCSCFQNHIVHSV